MQLPEPTSEHQWLQQLVGEWDFVGECSMGPEEPPSKSIGKQSTRALGTFWTLGEMENLGPDNAPMQSLITLGYAANRCKFVGSFVSGCMDYHWLYEGSLDADRKVLTLNAEGPSFSGDGSMTQYQDIVEVIDANTYHFSSQWLNPDGSWTPFMHSVYTRRIN